MIRTTESEISIQSRGHRGTKEKYHWENRPAKVAFEELLGISRTTPPDARDEQSRDSRNRKCSVEFGTR